MEFLVAIFLLAAFAFLVTRPLRPRVGTAEPTAAELSTEEMRARLAELEARRRARYQEIRDAQSDRASGKLSEQDFERLDAEMRSEAVQVLDEIADVRARLGLPPEETDPPPAAAG